MKRVTVMMKLLTIPFTMRTCFESYRNCVSTRFNLTCLFIVNDLKPHSFKLGCKVSYANFFKSFQFIKEVSKESIC